MLGFGDLYILLIIIGLLYIISKQIFSKVRGEDGGSATIRLNLRRELI